MQETARLWRSVQIAIAICMLENWIDKWRAVCAERCKYGSGASVWKPVGEIR